MPKAANRTISGIVTKSLAAAGAIASELRRHLADELERHGEALNPQQVIDLARDVLRQWEPLVAENLTAADLAAMIAGMSFVAAKLPDWSLDLFAIGLPASGPPPKLPPLLGSGGGGSDDPKLRFPIIDNALASLVDRQIVRRPVYDQLEADARARSFTIAGDITEGTIDDVRRVLMADVEAGTSYTGFRQRITEQLGGSPIGEAHLENVYRTNLQASFRDGREMLAAHPVVAEIFPYQEYVPIHDGRVREEHEALAHLGIDGTGVYRREDPFWDYFTPPWGYQCRCGVNLLGIADAARLGVKEASEWLETGVKPPLRSRLAEIPFKPTDGFGYRGRTSVAVRMATQGMLFETGKNKTLWEQPKPKPKQPDNPWQPYTGPRGGKGWKHAGTGVIVYQKERPKAGEVGAPEHGDILYQRNAALERSYAHINDPRTEADQRRVAIYDALRGEWGNVRAALAAEMAHGAGATGSAIHYRFDRIGMKDDEGGKLANAAAKALREYHASRGEFVPKVDNAAIGEAESKAKNEAWWTKVREAEDAKREKSRSEAIEWAHKNIDYTGPLHALTQDQAGALHWMRIERDTRKDAKDFAELKATIDNWRAEPEKADQAGNKAVSSYWKSRFRKYSYSWNKENKKHMPQLGEAADVAGDLWREANERLIKGQWYGWGEHDPLKKHEEAVKAACEAGKADEVPIEYLEENSYQSWVPAEIKGKIEDQHALRDFRNYRDGPEHRAIMRDLRAARSAARDILRPILDRADEAKTVKLRDPEAYAKLDQEIEKNARDAESNKSALEYIARESGHKASIYTLLNDNVKPELRDEWKWRNDARLQYNVKSGQLTRAKREMDREAQEDWLWHVLGDEQPTGEGHVNFSGADFLDDAGKDHLDHAAAFLQKLLGGRLGRIDVGLKRNTSKDGRESASGHSVNLEPNSPTWTIIHEVGHVIDHHAGGELGHYSRAYAVQRLAEQRVEPAWPGTRYERWERMHQDGMRDEYCGKFYPYHDANEILSMGIQWLFWDAHDFYDQDPDHFEYTLAALRGLLT